MNDVATTDRSAVIATQIRDLINVGRIAPGVHLHQVELAGQFAVSRLPVREALQLLAAEGIVQHDPKKGFYAPNISSEEVRQLYRMRGILETDLMTTITWPTPEQMADLENRVLELERMIDQHKIDLWTRLHFDFHVQILNLSPRKAMVREILRLWGQTNRYRSLLPLPQKNQAAKEGTQDEHRLLAALREKNYSRLLQITEEGRKQIEQILVGVLEARGL